MLSGLLRGGREGLGEVDTAINRFETLIDVYVCAIENLESRSDIGSLSAQDLKGVVDRMERILKDWEDIKNTLQGVKEQVELAMEWEELWNSVLGDIGMELEKLNRLIFEMEERRHKNSLLDAMAEPGQGLDIKELETIVEEAPIRRASPGAGGSRLSIAFEGEAAKEEPAPQEDSNLLSLFARMQPLRASLDFTPMRLSAFLMRAKDTFPSGCDELERRMEFLGAKYRKLESDAESLRKELGEDRWVLIFRKAGRQALKMCESVERSVAKLRDALDDGAQHTNTPALSKKIENYEAKREHYGPAIQQVLAIIDRGVQSRLTVNGEILRLQADMQRRWADLDALLKGMDFALEQLNIGKTSHLRDSISTILSEERSVASSAGTLYDTPGSSPASSVVLLSRHGSEMGTSTPFSGGSKSRQGSFTSSTTARGKRYSSMPASMSNSSSLPRKTPGGKSSLSNLRQSFAGVSARLYPPPTPSRSVSRNSVAMESRPEKPRWNSSTSLRDTALGHNFKPLSATTPSPYRKEDGLLSPRGTSHPTPIPSPLGRSFSSRPPSTVPPSTPLPHTKSGASRPRLSLAATTSNVPQSHIRPHPPKQTVSAITVTPAMESKRSALPRASMYLSGPTTPATPPSEYAGSRASIASSASTSTLTDLTSHRKQSISAAYVAGPDTPISAMSPSESHGGDAAEDSPSSRSTIRPASKASRPGTAMALGGSNRRLSMLPQPKRTVSSSVATAAAVAAMSGTATTPAASGRASRIGRGTSLGFNGEEKKRGWR